LSPSSGLKISRARYQLAADGQSQKMATFISTTVENLKSNYRPYKHISNNMENT
jgi:hypothetical protein